MGTPQTRCREMHQSGRVAIMLCMRSSPHAGSHFTFLMSSSVRLRRVPPPGIARFHRDEPLLGGAEDDGIVAAPAVRIRVLELFGMQQRAALLQQFDDGRIGVPDLQAVVLRQAVAQDAVFVHVAGGVEPVLHAGGKVFRTVRWRGVDHASAGVHGDVIGQHAENLAIQKRMLKVQRAPVLLPGKCASSRRIREAALSRPHRRPACAATM